MDHMIRRWMSVILVALLIAMAMVPAAIAESAYFNRTTKVYQKKSTSSCCITIKKGTKCTILGIDGDWAKVHRGGITAYMPVKYLDLCDRLKAYADRDTYVYASASTSSTKKKVSVNTELYIIGRDGDYWRVETKDGKTTAYIKMSHTSWSKVAVKSTKPTTSWKDKVVMMDWYDGGSNVLDRGDYAYIYDCETGIQVRIKRMGGTSHADVEPATAEDTAKLLKMNGGEFNWDSRAVILYSEGKYVACAINTMPHGDQTISNNNYDGQFCLHMVNSRTHGTDSINNVHQKAIKSAYNWAH